MRTRLKALVWLWMGGCLAVAVSGSDYGEQAPLKAIVAPSLEVTTGGGYAEGRIWDGVEEREETFEMAELMRRQSSLPSLVVGYLVPQVDPCNAPLVDWFRVVVDDLQGAGILAGANITIVRGVTANQRPLQGQLATDMATGQNAIGFLGVDSSFAEDGAYGASVYHIPLCDGSTLSRSLSLSSVYSTYFRTIPDFLQRVLAGTKFIRSQNWMRYTALVGYTYDSETLNALPQEDLKRASLELFVPALEQGHPDYTPQLQRIKNSGMSILQCDMDGPTLAAVLTIASNLNMINRNYVWIIPGDAYDFIIRTNVTLVPLMEGAIVISSIRGRGPVWDSLVSRWRTPAFMERYPLLQQYATPPSHYLPFHTCLDLLLRGYDRLLHQNNNQTLQDLAAGWKGSVLPRVDVPRNFTFPDYQTITGVVSFNGNTRVGHFTYSYIANGVLIDFATSIGDAAMNFSAPVLYFGSTTIPPDTISGDHDDESHFWMIHVVLPITVCFGTFILVGAGVAFWRWKRHKRQRELPPTKPLGHFPKLDTRGPAQKAMEILQESKDPAKKRKLSAKEIDFIIDVLNSGGAFNPNLDRMEGAEGAKVDAETRAWVLDILAASPSSHGPNGMVAPVSRQSSDSANNVDPRRMSKGAGMEKGGSQSERSRSSIADGVASAGTTPSGFELGVLRQRRGSLMGSTGRRVSIRPQDSIESTRSGLFSSHPLEECPSQEIPTQSIPTDLDLIDQVKIMDYLTVWYHSWNFDMFQFAEMTNGHPLYYSGVYLVQSSQALGQLQLDMEKFKRWILLMEAEYHPHPYHNAIHAADVLHALNYLLLEDPLAVHYTPLEVLALLMGAVGHDIDHPGFNNNFLVKSHHPWAILYCDSSVLELHHCAHLFSMTLSSPWNIFADLTNDEYDELRRVVIRVILATDMGKHFEYINKFKSKITAGQLVKLDQIPENRIVIAEIAMKCSDLCNPTKTFALSSKWTEAVMEEFYRQGDKERELGLPISQFMDRSNTNVPKCQIGFIDILVAPLYDAWNTFHANEEKTAKIVREIGKNRSKWVGLTLSQTISPQQQQQQQGGGQSMAGASNHGLAQSAVSIASRNPTRQTSAQQQGQGLPSLSGSSGGLAPPSSGSLNQSTLDNLPSLPVLPLGASRPPRTPTGSLGRVGNNRISDTVADIRDKGGIIMNTGDVKIDGQPMAHLLLLDGADDKV
ncbi:uncharacterized protein SPPG_02406 [Spizellomyces punctatus DAOM BR117]|uniref:Phosphodiesterase n=1 Tax=Spizellomyces punctatus (strain DAOM BR117) TaxID=645134 RepID=A0A0L0HQM0_SPIPD|nr:uncharacterized protein SPPG_02406 [Spizellomyces punctatus DAOM BR117]KND03363.1 hypothetical protein SPPG_02406 [Spizellomyces punctatus DAOM BR117]|eukprot:XP_016611402.1 hypothetical protein SPPG_02406 [Spizellomyces punctatus DAOM BR117]